MKPKTSKKKEKNKQHIKLRHGKIVYASDEVKTILALFYFAFHADQVMKLAGKKSFKSNVVKTCTEMLGHIGLSWNDIPEDNKNWGVVLDFINKQKNEATNGSTKATSKDITSRGSTSSNK